MGIEDNYDLEKTFDPAASATNAKEVKPEKTYTPKSESAAIDLGLMDFFRDHQKFLTLSPEGTKFIEDMKRHNVDITSGFKFEAFNSQHISAVYITNSTDKCGILLGFSETATKSSDTPAAYYLDALIAKVKETSNAKMLNMIVIGPEDYTRALPFFQAIRSHFESFITEDTPKLLVSRFFGYEISVTTTNMMEATHLLQKICPHVVMPRMDVAAVVKIAPGPKYRMQEEPVPIAIVTGYVDFVGKPVGKFNDSQVKFKSLFHMEIHSTINDPALIALVVMPVVDMYCKRGHWKKIFDHYGPGDINVGCLIPEKRGSNVPWKATDRYEMDDFMDRYVDPNPIPVLDIFGGKHQLPLAKYLATTPDAVNQLKFKIARFFGMADKWNEVPEPIVAPNIVTYAGVIHGEVPVDSRKIDYLFLTNKTNNMDNTMSWLNYNPNAAVRAEALAALYPHKFENRYFNFIKVINPAFIKWISAKLAENKITFDYDGGKFDSEYSGGVFTQDVFDMFKTGLEMDEIRSVGTETKVTKFNL